MVLGESTNYNNRERGAAAGCDPPGDPLESRRFNSTENRSRMSKHPLALGALLAAGLVVSVPVALAQQPAPAGDAKAAHQKIAMCEGCHGIPGYRTAYPEVYPVPKLGGQQPGYLMKALQAYKSGQRSHPSMRGIAAGLSEQDMADLAAYYGGAATK